MGKVAGGAAKIFSAPTALLSGGKGGDGLSKIGGSAFGSLGGLIGLGPEYGEHFTPDDATGKSYRDWARSNPDEIQGLKGTQIATDQVMRNPILQALYGDKGLQGQLATEGTRLANQGFSLQPEDHEAYGQISGDVARQFGQQESDAARSLARRGLGGADSGAAGAAFSGLAGNKNEMLAKAQMGIAQRRVEDTRQRLNDNRQMQAQLGNQGSRDIESQFQRQVGGHRAYGDQFSRAAGNEQGLNEQKLAAVQDKRLAKNKTLFDAWGEGTYSGLKQGTASSTASWASMGGAGSMMGGGGGGGGMGGMGGMG